jgi:hypothetical protein
MKFIVETKDDKVLIEAEDKDHALAKYFKDIIEQNISLEKIGSIIILSDGEEQYPMRTVPLLWKMGALSTRLALDNLQQVLGISRFEAKKLLRKYGDVDAHLVPLIDELKLREEG